MKEKSQEYKEGCRKRSLDLWQKEDYRRKISDSVSKGQKERWLSEDKQWKKKAFYDVFIRELEFEGYTALNTLEEYLKIGSKMAIRCPNGHLIHYTWKQWKRGQRCNECRVDLKLKKFNEVLTRKNYDLEEIYFTNKRWFLPMEADIICPKNHKSKIIIDNFLNGHECKYCFKNVSEIEYELRSFFDLNNLEYLTNDRELIKPLELDFVFPKNKIAVEFNGYPFHTEIKGGINKNYHLNKTLKCEKKGYRLIHIFYDEWENKKRCLTQKRLLNLFNLNNEKIYARKCFIKEIKTTEAKKFCEENHIQGYSNSKIKLGLFYNEKLVSLMMFSKPNRAKGNRKNKNNIWELSRFCSSTNVVGAAGKLLAHFKKNFTWDLIFTYADRRWSIGDLYEKIGFTFIKNTPPNYWYTDKNGIRYYRYKFRKSQLIGEGTEWEIMKKNGYDRIWDCGHKLYEMRK